MLPECDDLHDPDGEAYARIVDDLCLGARRDSAAGFPGVDDYDGDRIPNPPNTTVYEAIAQTKSSADVWRLVKVMKMVPLGLNLVAQWGLAEQVGRDLACPSPLNLTVSGYYLFGAVLRDQNGDHWHWSLDEIRRWLRPGVKHAIGD